MSALPLCQKGNLLTVNIYQNHINFVKSMHYGLTI